MLPLFIPSFVSSLVTKMMIFGLFGMSLNLIWGYANIPSFGHAAFFGVGAYTAAIVVMKIGLSSFWLSMLLAILVTAAVAAILGVPGVPGVRGGGRRDQPHLLPSGYDRLRGAAFASGRHRCRSLTGGTTGISGIPNPEHRVRGQGTPRRVSTTWSS